MQEKMQRLQQETAAAHEAAQIARETEFATRQHAARLDAALQQADQNVRAMQMQSMPRTETVPTIFAPDNQGVSASSDTLVSAGPQQLPNQEGIAVPAPVSSNSQGSALQPVAPAPIILPEYTVPPEPMSISPPIPENDQFQSPMEDRSTVTQATAQPTQETSDTQVSAPIPVAIPAPTWKRRGGFCTTFNQYRPCTDEEACTHTNEHQHATARRQISFETPVATVRYQVES